MELFYELLAILITSFAFNMIPFAGPSNLLIASNAALLVETDPLTIGFLVALGSASAKLIHFMASYFVGNHIGEERRKRLDAKASKIRRWAFLAVFAAAATPVPDEPVIIPLGLLKYNPLKFYVAFFAGKLTITIVGAYLGKASEQLLSSVIPEEILMIVSLILTIIVTVMVLRIDIGKIVNKIRKRTTSPLETNRDTYRNEPSSSV